MEKIFTMVGQANPTDHRLPLSVQSTDITLIAQFALALQSLYYEGYEG